MTTYRKWQHRNAGVVFRVSGTLVVSSLPNTCFYYSLGCVFAALALENASCLGVILALGNIINIIELLVRTGCFNVSLLDTVYDGCCCLHTRSGMRIWMTWRVVNWCHVTWHDNDCNFFFNRQKTLNSFHTFCLWLFVVCADLSERIHKDPIIFDEIYTQNFFHFIDFC